MKLISSSRIQNSLEGVLFYSVLIPFTLLCLLPFIWTISTSFKSNDQVFSYPPQLIPAKPTLEGYVNVATDPQTLHTLFNSVWLTVVSVIVVVSLSAISGYAMSRFDYRGKSFLRIAILITQMLPPVFVLVAYVQLVNALGIYNTYGGLLLGWCSFGVPFSTLILHGVFNTIPVELDEAALLDGCNRIGALFRVVLPCSLPGLLGAAAVMFVGIWGDLLLVLIMTRSKELWTLIVFLSSQVNLFNQFWNNLSVLALIASIPLVILWILGQRYIVSGMTAGLKK